MRLLQCCPVNFVVLSDGPMDAEDHRLGLAWQMCDAKRALLSFDARLRDINDTTHSFLLSTLKNRLSSIGRSATCAEWPPQIVSRQGEEPAILISTAPTVE